MSSVCSSIFVIYPAKNPATVSGNSRYLEPLGEGAVRGNSRNWGDASFETQRATMREIVNQGELLGFSAFEISFALAVARTESGFNPDAASSMSSASGVGQLIDRTAEHYGLTDDTRFSLRDNVRAMYKLLREVITAAKKTERSAANIFSKAYGLYHDGPSLAFGGESIAKQKVLPEMVKAFHWLSCEFNLMRNASFSEKDPVAALASNE